MCIRHRVMLENSEPMENAITTMLRLEVEKTALDADTWALQRSATACAQPGQQSTYGGEGLR